MQPRGGSTRGQTGTFKVKAGLAQMAKGGIIMDVTTAEEARIAEEAGVSKTCNYLYFDENHRAVVTSMVYVKKKIYIHV